MKGRPALPVARLPNVDFASPIGDGETCAVRRDRDAPPTVLSDWRRRILREHLFERVNTPNGYPSVLVDGHDALAIGRKQTVSDIAVVGRHARDQGAGSDVPDRERPVTRS